MVAMTVAACGSNSKKQGGFYKDDGPSRKKVDIDSIPNAVPRNEPFRQATLKPYTINGKRYVPLKSADGFVEEGIASWYGRRYHGRKTSTGEVYDMFQMTAAHPTLPLPSYVRVTSLVNQRSVIVRVNDRGPFIGNRIIDLSYVAAKKLGVVNAGTGKVIVETISSNQPNSLVTSPSIGEKINQLKTPTPDQNQAYRYTLPPSDKQDVQSQTQVSPNQVRRQTPSANQWIQVGAFSVRQNAQDLSSRLAVSGYANTQIVQQGNLYKVLVGPLNQQQFIPTQQSLKTNGYSAIRSKP